MKTIDIEGTALALEERGAGEPVVLVHGSASDLRTWRPQADAFAERHRVLSYSRRHHWPNAAIPAGTDYAMERHVEDLARLVGARGLAPAHLVGHSYGAFVCLRLALREPGLVRSLVLAEPPVITLFVSLPPRPVELVKLALRRPRTAAAIIRFGAGGAEPAARAFRRRDPDAAIRVFGNAVFGPGGFDRLPAKRRAQVMDNISNVRAELLGSGFPPLDDDEVRALDRPVLIVNGEHSIALFHLLADRLEELLPRVERVEIPGASHLMHEDNPAAFNEAVLAFLERPVS